MSIEKPHVEDYEHKLRNYMTEHQWSPERQADMMRYIGHHFVSAEATLGVLDIAHEAHDDVDRQMATQ